MSFIHKQLGGEGSFGSDLKELRELRGLTREHLAEITNIHTSVIEALEEENLIDLKDPVYAERHVRTLALTLESQPTYFLKKYRKLLKLHQITYPDPLSVHSTIKKKDFFVTPKLVTLGGFFCLVFFVTAYLFWQAYLLQEPPPLNILSPQDGMHLDFPRVDVSGETVPSAVVTVNGQNAVVDRDGNFSLKLDLPRGLSTLNIEARRRYGSPVSKIMRVTYERPVLNDEIQNTNDE
ncbi:MAG: helix-turn-helix domain-containing protein [Patescibacteria group bacterium]|nr:helix-turn-helix domain-containing protein [Patescibacteria group bacterium]MBU2509557.1 helix-turn-helix domain-containing protein [Patescibacteria group bacterium]